MLRLTKQPGNSEARACLPIVVLAASCVMRVGALLCVGDSACLLRDFESRLVKLFAGVCFCTSVAPTHGRKGLWVRFGSSKTAQHVCAVINSWAGVVGVSVLVHAGFTAQICRFSRQGQSVHRRLWAALLRCARFQAVCDMQGCCGLLQLSGLVRLFVLAGCVAFRGRDLAAAVVRPSVLCIISVLDVVPAFVEALSGSTVVEGVAREVFQHREAHAFMWL
jgi:hypothetical protein